MNSSYTKRKRIDYVFAILVFVLISFGIMMIYSVSKYLSLQNTNQGTDKLYLEQQMISFAIGIVACIFFQMVDYKFWQKHTTKMLIATLLLLASVFIFGGDSSSGSRWINLFGMGFQPSELAKLTMIIYLSGWLASRKSEKKIKESFWPFIAFVGLVSLLMLVQKDLGTLTVIIMIAASIFYAAGATLQNLLVGGGLGAFLMWLAIKIEPYRMQRLTAFFNPNSETLSTSYHIRNALIAIGSGGIWGLGFGQSKQKYLYLPEAHTDSIFAIVCEELGFLRSSLVIIMYGLIVYRGYKIARNAPDTFSQLLAIGIVTWIAWQTFVNLGAMMAILPLTGVPLPFISYGGTSLIAFLAGVGILLNISKHSES